MSFLPRHHVYFQFDQMLLFELCSKRFVRDSDSRHIIRETPIKISCSTVVFLCGPITTIILPSIFSCFNNFLIFQNPKTQLYFLSYIHNTLRHSTQICANYPRYDPSTTIRSAFLHQQPKSTEYDIQNSKIYRHAVV